MRDVMDGDAIKAYGPEGFEERAAFDGIVNQLRMGSQMKLVSPEGDEVEVPGHLYRVLLDAAEVLASGRGISIVPHDELLTTQQAADFLGMSRPTLVKLLEADEIPFSRVGRHRRVRFDDVLAFHERSRAERRARLRRLARDEQRDGLLEVVYTPPEG